MSDADTTTGVRDAQPSEAGQMAALAEAKRQHYREHASPFQRPAADGESVHTSFLLTLMERDGFVVLVHEVAPDEIDGFLVARVGSAPPPFGEGALLHIDDFALATPGGWATVGHELLREVASRAATTGAEKAIVVSGPPSIDKPKTDFLAASGFVVEAEWWVKALEPSQTDAAPEKDGFDAAVGPAPPVYDPGGLTCLALRIDTPAALQQFEAFANASDAVVAIVPTLTSRDDVRDELIRRGYTIASEWYAAPVARLV